MPGFVCVQVCLVQEGRGALYAFPNSKVSFEQEPGKAALDQLRHQTNLIGKAILYMYTRRLFKVHAL